MHSNQLHPTHRMMASSAPATEVDDELYFQLRFSDTQWYMILKFLVATASQQPKGVTITQETKHGKTCFSNGGCHYSKDDFHAQTNQGQLIIKVKCQGCVTTFFFPSDSNENVIQFITNKYNEAKPAKDKNTRKNTVIKKFWTLTPLEMDDCRACFLKNILDLMNPKMPKWSETAQAFLDNKTIKWSETKRDFLDREAINWLEKNPDCLHPATLNWLKKHNQTMKLFAFYSCNDCREEYRKQHNLAKYPNCITCGSGNVYQFEKTIVCNNNECPFLKQNNQKQNKRQNPKRFVPTYEKRLYKEIPDVLCAFNPCCPKCKDSNSFTKATKQTNHGKTWSYQCMVCKQYSVFWVLQSGLEEKVGDDKAEHRMMASSAPATEVDEDGFIGVNFSNDDWPIFRQFLSGVDRANLQQILTGKSEQQLQDVRVTKTGNHGRTCVVDEKLEAGSYNYDPNNVRVKLTENELIIKVTCQKKGCKKTFSFLRTSEKKIIQDIISQLLENETGNDDKMSIDEDEDEGEASEMSVDEGEGDEDKNTDTEGKKPPKKRRRSVEEKFWEMPLKQSACRNCVLESRKKDLHHATAQWLEDNQNTITLLPFHGCNNCRTEYTSKLENIPEPECCPKCHKTTFRKSGFSGGKQRYICLNDKFKFIHPASEGKVPDEVKYAFNPPCTSCSGYTTHRIVPDKGKATPEGKKLFYLCLPCKRKIEVKNPSL